MSSLKNQLFSTLRREDFAVGIAISVLLLAGAAPARAQNEKRTVFKENDFHWQGKLKPGQTLEITGGKGGMEGKGAAGEAAQGKGVEESPGEANKVFGELVEYADGVPICGVYE